MKIEKNKTEKTIEREIAIYCRQSVHIFHTKVWSTDHNDIVIAAHSQLSTHANG